MVGFENSWLFRPLFDYEYKMYQVLAYAQNCNDRFENDEFYPYLIDLYKQLNLVQAFESEKKSLELRFKSELEKIDLEKMQLVRKGFSKKDEIWTGVEAIMELANAKMSTLHDFAIGRITELKEDINIESVGIYSNNRQNGYLFFHRPLKTRVYSYELRLIRSANSLGYYKDVKTDFIEEHNTGFVTNFSNLKLKYINSDKGVGTNVFLVETNTEIPFFETLVPLVKSYLINRVA